MLTSCSWCFLFTCFLFFYTFLYLYIKVTTLECYKKVKLNVSLAYTHFYRLNVLLTLTVSTGDEIGQHVQSHLTAPQVQSLVRSTLGQLTAPQVSVNMRSRAVVSKRTRPSQQSSRSLLMAGFTVYRQRRRRLQREGHCSMISLRFSCRMVSLTAWKTKRMFSVSTAVVKWWKSGFPRFLLLRLKDCTRKAWKWQSKDT